MKVHFQPDDLAPFAAVVVVHIYVAYTAALLKSLLLWSFLNIICFSVKIILSNRVKVLTEKEFICKHSHLFTGYKKTWSNCYVKARHSSNKYRSQKTKRCSNVLSTTEWKFWKWSLRKWDGAQKFSNEHHFQQVGFAINQLSQISSYHDTKPLFG